MMRDMKNNIAVANLGTFALSGTTAQASQWVDVRDFSSATLVLVTNDVTNAGTAAGFTATLQEGTTLVGADAADVVADLAVGQENTVTVTSDAADNDVAGGVGYAGNSRYIRFNMQGTTGTNASVTVLAVLGKPNVAPPTFEEPGIAAS